MTLEEKIAMVVGVRDEVGRATAIEMARLGAKVVVAELESARGESVVAQIKANGGEAIYQELDITLSRLQQELIDRIAREYGRLDVVFNNVSIGGDFLPLASQLESVVAETIDVNYNGVWISLKYQIEQMLKNGGGVIVNNVSNFKPNGTLGCSVYQSTRYAVAHLSSVAALEYARQNIRINCIAPGIIARSLSTNRKNTTKMPMIPLNRPATPQEIAQIVVWLCSEGSAYITGEVISVDGGLSAKMLKRY